MFHIQRKMILTSLMKKNMYCDPKQKHLDTTLYTPVMLKRLKEVGQFQTDDDELLYFLPHSRFPAKVFKVWP